MLAGALVSFLATIPFPLNFPWGPGGAPGEAPRERSTVERRNAARGRAPWGGARAARVARKPSQRTVNRPKNERARSLLAEEARKRALRAGRELAGRSQQNFHNKPLVGSAKALRAAGKRPWETASMLRAAAASSQQTVNPKTRACCGRRTFFSIASITSSTRSSSPRGISLYGAFVWYYREKERERRKPEGLFPLRRGMTRRHAPCDRSAETPLRASSILAAVACSALASRPRREHA